MSKEGLRDWTPIEIHDLELTVDDAKLQEERRLNRERVEQAKGKPMIDIYVRKATGEPGTRNKGWHNGTIRRSK